MTTTPQGVVFLILKTNEHFDFRERLFLTDDLRLRDLRFGELIFWQRPDFLRRVVFPGTHFTRHRLFDLLRIIPVGHVG